MVVIGSGDIAGGSKSSDGGYNGGRWGIWIKRIKSRVWYTDTAYSKG